MSFSDGRAFCYLVHHYHPSVLPLGSIRTETTLTYKGRLGLSGGNESVSDDSLDGESSGMLCRSRVKIASFSVSFVVILLAASMLSS